MVGSVSLSLPGVGSVVSVSAVAVLLSVPAGWPAGTRATIVIVRSAVGASVPKLQLTVRPELVQSPDGRDRLDRQAGRQRVADRGC